MPCRLAASGAGRDVFNEPPSKEDVLSAADASSAIARARLGGEAVVHTSCGDIFIKLMPDIAPKVRLVFTRRVSASLRIAPNYSPS